MPLKDLPLFLNLKNRNSTLLGEESDQVIKLIYYVIKDKVNRDFLLYDDNKNRSKKY